jgi:hypothetical protein
MTQTPVHRRVLNPDDPDGDYPEVAAWFNPMDIPGMGSLRPECMGTPWMLLRPREPDVDGPVHLDEVGHEFHGNQYTGGIGGAAAGSAGDPKGESYWDKLSPDSQKALSEYSDSSNQMNQALRAGQPETPEVKAMDQAVSEGTLDYKTYAYRGLPGGSFGNLQVGDIVSDKAFLSVTTDEGMAQQFAMNSSATGLTDGIVASLEIPAGTHAGSIGGEMGAQHFYEEELVLGRDTQMMYQGKSDDGTQMMFEVLRR